MLFENGDTKKLKIVIYVCFTDSSKQLTGKKNPQNISLLPDVCVSALIKFRCSCSRLPMEAGRQQNLPREDRKCMKCNLSVAGNEFPSE